MEKRKREEERRRERRDRKRDSVPSTDALLPIEDVMDGVIVTRDSRFLAVSEFSPVSFMSLSLAEKRQAADRFARVLKAFPASVQVKSVSFRADTSKLEEVMTSADIPSGDGAEKLRSEYLSMLRGAGSAGMVTRRLFVIYEAGGIEVSFDETRQRLDRMRHTLESMMLSAGISPVRGVETDEGLLRFLFSLLNRDRVPSRFDERVRKTAREYGTGTRGALCVSAARLVAPDRISFVSPSVMDISGRRYVFGYVPGTSIPPSVTAGWLTGLMCRGEGVDVDMFFEKLPSARAASRIGRRVRNNRAKATSSTNSIPRIISRFVNQAPVNVASKPPVRRKAPRTAAIAAGTSCAGMFSSRG